MENIHYLKREKHEKIIQLWVVKEFYDEHGYHKRSVKFDIDPGYKTIYSYLQYNIPHEELTEISADEFKDLCCRFNCLCSSSELPAPGNISNDTLVSNPIN
jgi:hypothetical protein